MINLLRIILFVLITGWSFTACDPNKVFDQYYEIPDALWNKDSIVQFDIQMDDTIRNHNLYIQIRNETNYGFSNIWLFIDVVYPDGEAVRDTFEVVLAEPSGKWLGKGYGGIKTSQVIYQRDVVFYNSGTVQVSIRHGMREENLKGIHDVGFRIEKVLTD